MPSAHHHIHKTHASNSMSWSYPLFKMYNLPFLQTQKKTHTTHTQRIACVEGTFDAAALQCHCHSHLTIEFTRFNNPVDVVCYSLMSVTVYHHSTHMHPPPWRFVLSSMRWAAGWRNNRREHFAYNFTCVNLKRKKLYTTSLVCSHTLCSIRFMWNGNGGEGRAENWTFFIFHPFIQRMCDNWIPMDNTRWIKNH